MDISDILANNPIVIDQGSFQWKAGFGGEDKPKLIFQSQQVGQYTSIGRPKYRALPMTSAQQEYYIGNQINDQLRGVLKLKYPFQKGHVSNWNEMEQLCKYTFNELKVNAKEAPLLLLESSHSSLTEKRQMASLLFENMNVPALFFANSGVLSLFATGKTTGVVLDSGDTISQSVAVYDGYYLQHAANQVELAGRDASENLQMLLKRQGYIFNTTAEMEIVRKMKEKSCYLSPSTIAEETYVEQNKYKNDYMLPDNSVIQLSGERPRAAEILMQPEKYGMEIMSLPEMLLSTIQKVDLDIRKSFYNDVILTGGNTLFSGFPERLVFELKKQFPQNAKVKVWTPPDRISLSWQGGSILSHLPSFKNMWISKREFSEEGDRIFVKKQL